jgi:membrane associated rhomboid family serine protease
VFLPIGSNLPFFRFPFFTVAWIVLSVALYFGVTRVEIERSAQSQTVQSSADEAFKESLTYKMSFVPATHQLMSSWKCLTYQFTHASFGHLVSNMWYLAIFGWILENAIGGLAFLSFSLFFAALAVLSELIFQSNLSIPIIGASGSVAFMMGATVAMFPRSKVKLLFFFFPLPNFPNTFFVPIRYIIYVWLALQVSGLAQNVWIDPKPIAFATHLAGFGFGVCIGMLLGRRRKNEKLIDIELSGRDLKKFYQSLKAFQEEKTLEATATLESLSDGKPWVLPLQLQLFKIGMQYHQQSLCDRIWKNVLPSLLMYRRCRETEWMLDHYWSAFSSLPDILMHERVQLSRLLKPIFEQNEQLLLHLSQAKSSVNSNS